MWRVSRRELVAARGRLSLTVVAVALGVAFIVAAGVVGASLQATIGSINDQFSRNTDAVVEGRNDIDAFALAPPVSADTVAAVEAVDGVAGVARDVATLVDVLDAEGESLATSETVSASLIAWPEDSELNVYELVEGEAPNEPGDVVLDRFTVDDADLELGDTVVLSSAAAEITGRLVGIVTIDGNDGFGGAPLPSVLFEDAERLQGFEGAALVRVRGDGSVSQGELTERIEAVLPDDNVADTGEAFAEEVEAGNNAFISFIRNALTGFALVALLVGSFLVANTFAMVIAQRQRQLALLRAVGATKGQVRRAVLVEAFAVSLLSSLLGAGAGIGLGWVLLQVLDLIGLGLPVFGLRMDYVLLVVGVVLGTVLGVLAAIQAVRSATRVAPVAALKSVGVTTRSRGVSVVRVVVGAVLAVAAVVLIASPNPEGVPAALLPGSGALAAVLAVILLNPLVARVATPGLLAALPGRGAVAMLARRNAARNPGRVAGTASALLVGIAIVVGATTIATSASASLGGSAEESLSGTTAVVSSSVAQVPEEVPDRLRDLPEVGAVATITGTSVVLGDDEEAGFVDAVSPDLDTLLDADVAEGVGPGELADDQVALLVDQALDLGVEVGDPLEVTFVDGSTVTYEVAGTYRAGVVLSGVTFADTGLRERGALEPGFATVLASTAGGAEPAETVAAVGEAVPTSQGEVQTVTEFVDGLRGAIDQLVQVVTVLLGLTLIIALIGIINTTILSTLERTQEFGMLRAIGTTRGQLRSAVRLETVAITLYGTVVGVVVGLALGVGYTATLADEGISTIEVPWVQLVVIVVLAILAGVLAAYFPARRASRMNVLDAIRAE